MKLLSAALSLGLCLSTLVVGSSHAASLKFVGEGGKTIATLDRAQIEALGLKTIKTSTPWTDGIVHFEGVELQKVFAKAGIKGGEYTAIAMDDYAAFLTDEMIEEHQPLIATRMDGGLLPLDNRGPFWIVFDYDSVPNGAIAELGSLSVWHLVEFEVE